MNKKFLLIGIFFLPLFIFLLVFLKNQQKIEPPKIKEEKKVDQPSFSTPKKLSPPTEQIDKNKKYTAVLNTSKGTIKIELNSKQTPLTVSNFVYLSRKNFYNKTIFHRVIKGFMIQGGDPKGDGTGGPGYKFSDEPFEGEYERGVVAMANSGSNTNGSQFFIMHQDYALPKNYVIFGKVIEGIEVVDKITESPVQANSFGENSKPVEPTVLESVEIIEE